MIDETDFKIKNLFLDVIHYCGDLQGAFNRVGVRYSTKVKFTYTEIESSHDPCWTRQLTANITIDNEPVISEKIIVNNILMLEQGRIDLKDRLISSIFILGVISAKEKLDSVKNNKPHEIN